MGVVMFLGFILVVVLGFILAKLGAYSVWMTVLSVGVKVLAAVLVLPVVFIFLDKFFSKKTRPHVS